MSARISPRGTTQTNRFHSGSWSDPTGFDFNWNRTFELKVDNPKAIILMIHGLSDSPYSMRSFALGLQRKGAWVVGLRLPGHGTAPAGLTTVHWRDFASAVRLAARHMNDTSGDNCPFYIVGYSTGAALALEYCTERI